ncbi:hypothetical protein HYFRA_00010868 [Hymenoscyphus fraxineus]|uniref:Uncharacterized protein n=1 Tax=Hymenoscyphus fraxineus TaxID=746836 RepID=A0A9N9KYP6_9HELO|nr:hypothetical protein HYFRA_00010868 [Hymenoscyphus fraxineus]
MVTAQPPSDERIITGKFTATIRSKWRTFASTNLKCDFETIVDDNNRPIDEKTLLEFMKGVASFDALAAQPGGVNFLPILWQCCYNELVGCFGVTEPGTTAFEEEL